MSRGGQPNGQLSAFFAAALGVGVLAACGTAQPHSEIFSDKVIFDLVKATPAPGSRIGRKTVVEAEVTFRIRGFSPGRYVIVPRLAREDGEPRDLPSRADVERAEGRLTLRVPISARGPKPEPAGPVALWLYLEQRVPSLGSKKAGATTPLARVGPLPYELGAP